MGSSSQKDFVSSFIFYHVLNSVLFVFSDVCTKYQEASKIVNLALTGLVSQCVAGAKIIDLCQVRLFEFYEIFFKTVLLKQTYRIIFSSVWYRRT